MKKILALLLVLILAVATFTACGEDKGKNDKDGKSESSATVKPDETSEPTKKPDEENKDSSNDKANPDYEAVFENTGIVHRNPITGMNTMSFAYKDDEGNVYCEDYGYEGDLVKKDVATIYTSLEGMTDDEKSEAKDMMEMMMSEFDEIECLSVKIELGDKYLVVVMEASDVDKPENYSALFEAGIIEENASISMSDEEQKCLDEGFVKK